MYQAMVEIIKDPTALERCAVAASMRTHMPIFVTAAFSHRSYVTDPVVMGVLYSVNAQPIPVV